MAISETNRSKIVLAIFGIICLYFWIGSMRFAREEKNSQFNGTIEKITYDIKETPEITVNGNSYIISTSWQFNEKMKVGDSIVKIKGYVSYKLIKSESGVVIYSTSH